MKRDPREAMLACASDPRCDIGEAALWLAAEDVAGVDVPRWLELLDELGEELTTRGVQHTHGAAAAPVLAALLRDRVHLRGAGGADPRAHYLHSVLERGAGVPIACGAVWMAVGGRAGVEVEGVGLPGHFAVRVRGALVDPFAGGDLLDEDAARRLVASALGDDTDRIELDPCWLRALTSAEVLARMSRNLRGCYASLNHWDMALRAADRCVALLPESPGERRDRGMLNWRLGNSRAALEDLLAYLDQVPESEPDRARVTEVVRRLRAFLN